MRSKTQILKETLSTKPPPHSQPLKLKRYTTDGVVSFYESADVDEIISALEDKIEKLQAEVKRLEIKVKILF